MTENNGRKTNLKFFGINKILPLLKTYRKSVIIMVAGGILGSLFDIVGPLLQRYALNHYVSEKTLDTILWFIILYIVVIAFSSSMNYIAARLATSIEVSIDKDLRNKAFEHLQTLSFSYYNQNSVGYIHSRVISDTSKIGTLFSWTVIDATWHTTYLIGAIVIMFVINAKLAALVVAILPIIMLLFAFFQDRLIKVNREIRETNSKITGNFNEGITGAKTIKSLVIEDKIENDFRKDTTAIRKKSIKGARLRGAFAATTSFASSLGIAVVLWRGGYITENEIGTFSMFMSYAQGMMEPVRWIIDAISDLIMTQVNIERFTKLIETQSDVKDSDEVTAVYGDSFSPKTENWEGIKGDIEFRNVSFRYPDGDEYVLENFNLRIPFGTNVAIVGETGAGKSTLVNLVCRFFEPTSGKILIDGKDVRERSQLWIHSALGYVLQTPHLFSGTIRENLKYGNPEATEKEIFDALDLVSATQIIERLENGLDTDAGEGGDMLSTGEKQLISFARAILAKPKILVLDEATASVDTITEQKIQSAIDTIIKGRTSLVIAHRLSTVRNADIILVVKDGKIIEQGTHKELMHAKGYYYNLYTKQYEEEATGAVFASR